MTVASGTPDGVQMQIRFSTGCDADWVKVLNLPSGWNFYIQDGFGNKLYWNQHDYQGPSAGTFAEWTGMVDGSRPVLGCFLDGACI